VDLACAAVSFAACAVRSPLVSASFGATFCAGAGGAFFGADFLAGFLAGSAFFAGGFFAALAGVFLAAFLAGAFFTGGGEDGSAGGGGAAGDVASENCGAGVVGG